MAESSGVVTAWPKYDESSRISGMISGVDTAERANESQIPDSRLDRDDLRGIEPVSSYAISDVPNGGPRGR